MALGDRFSRQKSLIGTMSSRGVSERKKHSQTTEYGVQQTIAQFIYNNQHRPLFVANASGQTASVTYNAAGQVTSVTNPLGQKTSYQYNATGDLASIINANNATAASFTYDAHDRIRTYTDSEGWTATYDYDAADRVTNITYPDGTARTYTYDRLDISSYQNRQFRKWVYAYDAHRRLTRSPIRPANRPFSDTAPTTS